MNPGRKKGTPKTGGRVKGTPNTMSAGVKLAIETTFKKIGGVSGLTRWAKGNPDEFYGIWAKLLPKNIDVSGEVTHRVINVVRSFPEGTDGAA